MQMSFKFRCCMQMIVLKPILHAKRNHQLVLHAIQFFYFDFAYNSIWGSYLAYNLFCSNLNCVQNRNDFSFCTQNQLMSPFCTQNEAIFFVLRANEMNEPILHEKCECVFQFCMKNQVKKVCDAALNDIFHQARTHIIASNSMCMIMCFQLLHASLLSMHAHVYYHSCSWY